jgi:hypothetical protein
MENQKNKFALTISVFIFLLSVLFASLTGQAQVKQNIVEQPLWGPTGYDYVEYYFLPESGVYYYLPSQQYIYLNEDNKWIYRTFLPNHYKVDLYSTYKVVLNESKPYLNHDYHVATYAKFKSGGPAQLAIRDSKESKYFVVRGHPNHHMANIRNAHDRSSANWNNAMSNEQRKKYYQQNFPAKVSGNHLM